MEAKAAVKIEEAAKMASALAAALANHNFSHTKTIIPDHGSGGGGGNDGNIFTFSVSIATGNEVLDSHKFVVNAQSAVVVSKE